MSLIRGESTQGYDSVYGAYLAVQRSVRVGSYKLILYPTISQQVLYNVVKDPEELTDLASNAQYADVKKKLFARLLQLQKQTGDTLDLTTVYRELQ